MKELTETKTRGAVRFARDVKELLQAAIELKTKKEQWAKAQYARQAKILEAHLDELIDATNNLAERQLRPAVITRKTNGCNRTEEGAQTHAILGSVLATCRQQAIPILEYLIKLQKFGETPPSLTHSLAPAACLSG